MNSVVVISTSTLYYTENVLCNINSMTCDQGTHGPVLLEWIHENYVGAGKDGSRASVGNYI